MKRYHLKTKLIISNIPAALPPYTENGEFTNDGTIHILTFTMNVNFKIRS